MRTWKLKVRDYALLAVLAAGVVSLAACGKKQEVQAAGPIQRAAPVVVASVTQRDIPVQVIAIGNVEAYQTVQIRSQVNGQIDGVHFKEGEDVHKGQLLFTLDKQPFQAALDQAIGNLQRDQAQAANAQAQATRYDELEKEGVISRELADQMRTQERANAAAVYADKAAVDAARVQLRYTDISAPLEARAGALQINLGNLVKANDTPFLVQLNQITPIYVTFSVPETRLDEIRRHSAGGRLKVQAYPKGQKENPAVGYLTFIDNGVDTQTATVKLKGTFENRDRRLWPGEFVDVVMELATQKDAVVVPTRAIQSGQQGDYVYVVTADNTAEARPVSTAITYQDLTQISKGLKPGERVVVDGQLRVVPNSKVIVQSTVSGAVPPSGPAGSEAAGGGL